MRSFIVRVFLAAAAALVVSAGTGHAQPAAVSGCENCQRVEQRATAAVEKLKKERPGLEATIQHVREVEEIMKYPILATPGLVVNEQLVSAGRIPNPAEIEAWLKKAVG